jgi:DNA adenine methylase
MEPVLKWAGGKRQLLSQLRNFVPIDEILNGNNCYYEPFVGGGSLCLSLELPNVVINDLNPEIVNVYEQILRNPDRLIAKLKAHKLNHSAEYYYKVREMDRLPSYSRLSPISKAARIIYLNRTCYNGLYRVNNKGQFNVPMGKYVNPDIVMESRIRQISEYLNTNNVIITNQDFSAAVQNAVAGDFIYFDPPYDYEKAGFTLYMQGGFSHNDTTRLKILCDELIGRGCIVMISNNETKFVTELFNDPRYVIYRVDANRSINSKGDKRRDAKEVIIYGRQ